MKKPLGNYRDIDMFKICASDLGLLAAQKNLVANDVLYIVEELLDAKSVLAEKNCPSLCRILYLTLMPAYREKKRRGCREMAAPSLFRKISIMF